jgi:hypothetical protein
MNWTTCTSYSRILRIQSSGAPADGAGSAAGTLVCQETTAQSEPFRRIGFGPIEKQKSKCGE